jgi:hypothetical protein
MFVKNKKNKKAVSELISYVLLVVLALAMAGGVYAYLKFYAQSPLPEGPCDGISISLIDYSCENNLMTIKIKNTGRFSTFTKVKLYNSIGEIIGEKDIPELSAIAVGETIERNIDYSDDVSKIEIIPFIPEKDNSGNIYTKLCPEVKIVQEIIDCEYESSGTAPSD